MNYRIALLAVLFMPMSVSASDYSTEAIVRNVIDCMAGLGGLTDANMYTCTCRADHIMGNMKFEEYESAATWDRNKQMAGDKGASVRDMELGAIASKKLANVQTESEAECPVVRHIEPIKIKKSE